AHTHPQCPQTSLDKGRCSTWGLGHFSTFDHHVYDFSGTCNYIFAATCKDTFPTFSIQLRRGPDGSITRIIVELGASVVTVSKGTISVKDIGVISPPYTSNGLQITPFGQSVRLVAKQLELELEVMWGPDAHLMVLVEQKYMGQMCGLCGNFDGKVTNEFVSEEGKLLEPHKFAALQKLDDPSEICAFEAIPSPPVRQAQHAQICTQLVTLVAPECSVPKEPFVMSCQADMVATQPGPGNSSCATLSEYSRQCSMEQQPVRRWRGPSLCPVGQCPANQVYQECGSACVKTCSNPQHSCSSTCTFGCFCPEGTVLNDLSNNHTCVPVTQCPCVLNGATYAPGAVTTAACRTCQCTLGRWACTERPCPGHCSLEGSSFVTTFDARPYRFHGTCTYILLQVALWALLPGDKIVISQDEVVSNNGGAKWLPYRTRNITVFRQSSTHLQMATSFGLELVVQLRPVFQAYITVGPQFRGKTRGLCGNFNGDTTDDFTTSLGIPEGTASLFVDSWRAGNCPAALERETDPCSMSQLNKVCAETHCSVLLRMGTVFERCHATVNPTPFYKRCVYQACNYEETFPHICAALGDYVHACSSRGVLLWGWRSSVENCTIPCTGNSTFSYHSQACERTCLSLSDRAAECHASAVPVDGCNCPDGTYLNHKGECVHKAQCPCTLEGYKFILAQQATVINGATCYCTNGRLSCPQRPQMFLASCPTPKTFESCSQSSENKFGAACAPTCQMLATGVTCVPTKCEPGCVCAKGLYENADGQCVPPEECPCEFSGVSYPGGAELHTDCRTCTCSSGRWACQQAAHCPSTCTLYGEGHIVTFDGQRFVFDGSCEYLLATDGCGANDSQPTFKILTENVVCGKAGVTCSRAIKLFLGGLSVVLADRNYTVSGEEPHVQLRVRPDALSLAVDVGVPGRYNLTLIWNRHMTILIRIARASQDAICGLCGNFNGNMKDDFETRSQYVASSELEFVNSWKESPLCGDVSFVADPCSLNAFRRSWAERKCSIINSQTFAACHSKVYHLPYYEACVRDACGCDSGGDCECLCDAVAAYAQACLDKGVCVDWRTPAFCPIYCGFYNTHTQDGHGEYQYTEEANCTWHYQPCLCPGRPQSVPGSNVEGCYNCSQDEYFDHEEGVCMPCVPPTTPQPPITGSRPTQVWPTMGATTIRLLSSTGPTPSSKSTTAGPTQTPLVPATLTPSKPTASSGEPLRPTTAITPQATSGQTPTATLRSTATKPAVTQATTWATASTTSPATKSTAQSTTRTTATPPIPATSGTSPTLAKSTHQELPGTTATQTTGPHPTAASTTSPTTPRPEQPTRPTATKRTTHTRTTTEDATPQMPHTTHSTATDGSPVSSTGPMTATSFKTTTTHPTPPHPETTLSTHVPPFSTSSGTLSTHTVIIHTHPPTSTSPSIHSTPTGTIPPQTTVKATGSTYTALPITATTSGTSQAHSSFSTAKTSTSLSSHASSTHHPETTPASSTTITPKTTSRGTGTPVATTSATKSQPPTPLTTHSPPTGSNPVSSTGPMTATSFKTTTTHPTTPHPETTLSTHIPHFSTSSVTPSTHTVITPTHPQMSTSPSIHSTPTGTMPPQTTDRATGSTHTAPPMTATTSGTSQAHSSFSTATTSISLHSQASSTHYPETTPIPTTTSTPKATGTGPSTPVAHSTSATSPRPPTPFTTHSPPTGSNPISSTGPTTTTSFKTTTIHSTPPHSQTTLPTQVPPFSTSSVTPRTHTIITTTYPPMSTSPSIHSTPTGTVPVPTTVKVTGTTHTAPPITATTSVTSHAHSSFSTATTSTSLSSHASSTHHPETAPTSTTSIIPKPTGTGTSTLVAHSTSATSNRPATPITTHSPPTGNSPVSSAGPITATSFKTTTTHATPPHPETTLSTHVPPFSTSSGTPSSHTVITHTHPPMSTSPSTHSIPTGTIPPQTTVRATGSTHTATPVTGTTSGTSQAHSSFSTDTMSISLHSQASSTHYPETTPIPTTTSTPKPTGTGTNTPGAHSTSATSPRPPTPFTTHSPPTGSNPISSTATGSTSLSSHASSTHRPETTPTSSTIITPKTTSRGISTPVAHTTSATSHGPPIPFTTHSPSPPTGSKPVSSTGPMTTTSFKTTTTHPTPPHPHTPLSTHVPPFSTSAVTPSTHMITTHTQPPISTSPSIHSTPTGTIPPQTMVKTTGSTHTALPITESTSGTSQAHSSFSTATTPTPLHSHASSTHRPETIPTSSTTITPKPTGTGTSTPVAHTTS
uniref:Mucin 6, oligomeric mucus/gel-forming/pseudo n=1 Tax=Callithrix jacchus TaxID=9483 RepID=A0A8I3WPG2_CALJA